LGEFADPRVVGEVARLAEEAGWDGLFVWDHLIGYNRDLVAEFGAHQPPVDRGGVDYEPDAVGTQVTPVPRR
jgi:alkanesulfonate monooxygenase SsuD/methylene tetrahydromethanopterin reductase-like flavin-dependent oxidoreductase (luciferase family)